jgi:hypothetical protein
MFKECVTLCMATRNCDQSGNRGKCLEVKGLSARRIKYATSWHPLRQYPLSECAGSPCGSGTTPLFVEYVGWWLYAPPNTIDFGGA